MMRIMLSKKDGSKLRMVRNMLTGRGDDMRTTTARASFTSCAHCWILFFCKKDKIPMGSWRWSRLLVHNYSTDGAERYRTRSFPSYSDQGEIIDRVA